MTNRVLTPLSTWVLGSTTDAGHPKGRIPSKFSDFGPPGPPTHTQEPLLGRTVGPETSKQTCARTVRGRHAGSGPLCRRLQTRGVVVSVTGYGAWRVLIGVRPSDLRGVPRSDADARCPSRCLRPARDPGFEVPTSGSRSRTERVGGRHTGSRALIGETRIKELLLRPFIVADGDISGVSSHLARETFATDDRRHRSI